MNDPLMQFLMTRDREKVMAEGINLVALYSEAPQMVRTVIDVMPVGELRINLAAAESALAASRRARKEPVRVVANGALTKMIAKLRGQVEELEQRNKDQAGMIARLREMKEGK